MNTNDIQLSQVSWSDEALSVLSLCQPSLVWYPSDLPHLASKASHWRDVVSEA